MRTGEGLIGQALLTGLAGLCWTALSASPARAGETERVSVSSSGDQGNGVSGHPSISADGRCVAFDSLASNLVAEDTNDRYDVFVHDRQTGQTTRVSVSSEGKEGDDGSSHPSISSDGRYVAFNSEASNLVPDDTNGLYDIFVHDRQTGQTTRVSVSSSGEQGNSNSYWPSISADGRCVAFGSYASNLVPDDTNASGDVFVHDRQTGQTTRVSVSSSGEQGDSAGVTASISADGRYVAFDSGASNLVPDDTNGESDIFVHDRQTGQTRCVSVSSEGEQGNGVSYTPSISPDGRYVAFDSYASNLVPDDTNDRYDVFVHDRQTGQTTRVSVSSGAEEGNGDSGHSSVSADGRYVAFESRSSNLVPDDTNGNYDIFVHDRYTEQTTRVSVSSSGQHANGFSWHPSISADGRYVAFYSGASNLVPDDTNGYPDVFVHECCPGDLDGDLDTDQADLGILLADWGCDDPVNGCEGDLNGDDKTDQSDLGILLADWGCGT
jgi:Tol biopolymer transport system component